MPIGQVAVAFGHANLPVSQHVANLKQSCPLFARGVMRKSDVGRKT
jgi:hypothetical protein